jgi:hypothetical protein
MVELREKLPYLLEQDRQVAFDQARPHELDAVSRKGGALSC